MATSVRQRREYGIQRRLRAGFERGLSRRSARIITSEGRSAANGYKRRGLEGIGIALRRDDKKWDRLLTASYTTSGRVFGKRRLRALGVTGQFIDERLLDWIAQNGLDRAVGITSTTAEILRQEAIVGVATGESVTQIAERIRKRARSISRPRALAIARTEIGTATNMADFMAAEDSDIELDKVWLTARDGGSRHPSFMEGQKRKLDKPFDVQGSAMMHPHDPAGPARQIIHCRCSLSYEPK